MILAKEIEEIWSRKLCLVAIILAVIVAILRLIYDGTGKYNGYNPDCLDNVFADLNINENDIAMVSGEVVSITMKEVSGTILTTYTIKNVNFYEQKSINSTSWDAENGIQTAFDEKFNTADGIQAAFDENFNTANGIQVTSWGEKININVYDKPKLRHGQQVLFSGKLKYFKRATNWGEFDSYNYYRNKSILCSFDSAKVISAGSEYNRLFYEMWVLKNNISDILEYIYDEEDAAILKAMLLGVKNDISDEIKNAFQKSGIAHILAISGLHISFLCMFFYKILNKLGLHIVVCAVISEIVLVLYVIMIGFSPSSCRAAVMFTIYMLSVVSKRSYDMVSAMGIALIIILSFNKWSVFDFSVILSFIAVLSIGVYVKRFINNDIYLIKLLKKRDSAELSRRIFNFVVVKNGRNLVTILIIGLMTLPAILYSYYETTLYSWVLNLIFIPLMPVILVSAILSIIMTVTVNTSGGIFNTITCVILAIYKKSCIFLEESGFGRRNIGKPTFFQITLYIVLLSWVLLLKWEKYIVLRNAIFLAGLVILLTRNDYGLYMLDVGQGDCFVAIDQNNVGYIFDGGSTSRNKIGENVIIPFLKSRGVNRIEAVYISHPDEDHMNGIDELIEKGKEECITIHNVVVGTNNLQNKDFERITGLSEENGIKVVGMKMGDIHRGSNIEIECLYPTSDINMSDNNNSLVLRVQFGGFSFIETGDLEKDGEKWMLSHSKNARLYNTEAGDDYAAVLKADILKVGHHGSSSSSSIEFISQISPQIALISAGRNNSYGHPHKETIDTLETIDTRIFNAIETGAIRIRKKSAGIEVETYKQHAN